MPRPQRVHVPGGHFHVTLRGNHRESLFAESHDRHVLNGIVAENLPRYGVELHAYCWMTNHLHALVKTADAPLGAFMQRIAMRYAHYRQQRMNTTGHLFERRYGARYIETEDYFFAALRYIHLNPLAAGLVADPADYPRSSHRAYLGQAHPEWLTVDFGLSLFSFDRARARLQYRAYMQAPDDELEVTYPPKAPSRGSKATSETRNGSRSGEPRPDQARSLQSIAADVCAAHRVSLDDLRGPRKARCFSAARREVAQRAVAAGITALDVSAFINRDPSTVSRLLFAPKPPR